MVFNSREAKRKTTNLEIPLRQDTPFRKFNRELPHVVAHKSRAATSTHGAPISPPPHPCLRTAQMAILLEVNLQKGTQKMEALLFACRS